MEKEIIINNQLNEVTRISQFIEDLGTSLDLPTKLTMSIALAIEEVVTNIIQYTQTEKKPSQIFLQAVIEPGVLAFTITDEGAPLDPNRTVISPSKVSMEQQIIQEIGHLLIHRIMDEVSYHSDAKQNQLVLKKSINTNFKPGATLMTNICRVDGIIVLDIEGRLDTANARDFNNAIQPLLEEKQPNIIINCERMSYISSSGLRGFLILQKSVTKNGGSLAIEAMQPEIRHIFEITGCISIFNIR